MFIYYYYYSPPSICVRIGFCVQFILFLLIFGNFLTFFYIFAFCKQSYFLVVCVLINSNDDENISDEQLDSQISVLNKDFRANNDEIDNNEVDSIWLDRVGDSKIEFYKNDTIRVSIDNAATTCLSEGRMKLTENGGSDAINPKYFLNIWICNISSDGLLGYAYQPCLLGSVYEFIDGVVLSTENVGSTEYDTNNDFYFGYPGFYDLGRTGTHEVGHYLNLDHIWGINSV